MFNRILAAIDNADAAFVIYAACSVILGILLVACK